MIGVSVYSNGRANFLEEARDSAEGLDENSLSIIRWFYFQGQRIFHQLEACAMSRI